MTSPHVLAMEILFPALELTLQGCWGSRGAERVCQWAVPCRLRVRRMCTSVARALSACPPNVFCLGT